MTAGLYIKPGPSCAARAPPSEASPAGGWGRFVEREGGAHLLLVRTALCSHVREAREHLECGA